MNKVEKGTIIRTIVLAAALINQILTTTNKNPLPFSNIEIENAVSLIITIGASIWSWWKNNSFTKIAIAADQIIRAAKVGKTNGN